jgi:hypothetical protein
MLLFFIVFHSNIYIALMQYILIYMYLELFATAELYPTNCFIVKLKDINQ